MALSDQEVVWLGAIESQYGVDAIAAKLAANEDLLFQIFGADSELTPNRSVGTVEIARPSQDGFKSFTNYDDTDIALRSWPRPGVGANFLPEDDFLWATLFDIDSSGGVTTATLRSDVDASATIWQLRRKYQSNQWRLRRALGCLFSMSISDNPDGSLGTVSWAGKAKNCVVYGDALEYFDASDQFLLDEEGDPIVYTGAVSMASEDILDCSVSTVNWNGTDIDTNQFTLDIAYQIGRIAKPGCKRDANDSNYRISKSRAAGGVATGTVGIVCSEDDEAALETIREAILNRTAGTMVKRWENATRFFQATLHAQFEGDPTPRAENGLMHFDATYRLVGNRAAQPFGDNSCVIQWGAIP